MIYRKKQGKSEKVYSIDYDFKHEVAVDTETSGLDPFNDRLLSIQLGNSEVQYVITNPLAHKEEIEKVFQKDLLFIFHNASFDLKFLWANGFDIGPLYDTMIAEQVLNMGLYDTKKGQFSLKELVSKYIGDELKKEVRSTFRTARFSKEQIEYAAKDVEYLCRIKDIQIEKASKYGYVDKENLHNYYTVFGLEMCLTRALARIEYNGIYVDTKKLGRAKEELEAHLNNIEQRIIEKFLQHKKFSRFVSRQLDLFSDKRSLAINLSSPQDKLEVVKLLFRNIDTTNKDVLYEYKEKDKTGILELLIEYSETKKALSAFIDALPEHINSKTERIHTSFFQVLSANRIASRNPNLQNIPARGRAGELIRGCFVAPPNKKIVGGDYSGCELRIIAELSQDRNWLTIFNEGRDLHSELCALTFNIPIDKVREPFHINPKLKYRDVQKTINFGLAYGMGPQKLAARIGVSVDEAKDIINKFFSISQGVKTLLDRLERFTQDKKYIVTPRPYLRRRWLPYDSTNFKQKSAVGRKGKNTPIQGGNGEIIKLALVLLNNVIEANNYPVKIVNTIHDEIQTEVDGDFAEEWKNIMQEIMVQAGQTIIRSIPVEIDCKITDKWEK